MIKKELFEKITKGCNSDTMRKSAWTLMALSAHRYDTSPEEISAARDAGHFIEVDDLKDIEPGDTHEVDYLLMSLRDAGIDAGYVNVISTNSLTVSVFFIGLDELGIVSCNYAGSMVEEWHSDMYASQLEAE